jgi:beta-lactam-binding protein with PASTA domain/predicted Ser/Thr protein kinase
MMGRHDDHRDEASMTTSRLLSNRYELGDTLGYGGMSEVHAGRDIRLSRDVAVKVLRADLARDPTFQERFRREAQNAAALNHPAIVAVYDTGETQTEYGTLPYIVMEYVDGRTLRDMVKTEGPLVGKRAMEIMADVCAALDFSHRHGIVHRDVKPANVMITKTGAVKVMDFGIARAVADGQAAVTQTAAVIGTAQYLSPEQARGEAVDARSDVYAAGCVLFELLTAEPPFTGDSPVAVAYQHVREDPRAPSAVNSRVHPALDAIVLKAMAKGPANRYQSAAEMRGDLVRVLSGQRPSAPAVMTDADRTSIMGAGRTEVMSGGGGGGRHRPDIEDDYDDYDADEEDARRRKRGWTIAGIVVACVVVIALAAWLIPKAFGGGGSATAAVSVPDVKGQSAVGAQTALRAQHLGSTVKNITCGGPTPPASGPTCTADQVNKVVDTDPAAGTSVAPNSTVTLLVGVAPAQVTMPDLTGQTATQAATTLQGKGLVLSTATPATQPVEDSAQINKIVGQSVPANQQVAAGSTITITIGSAEPDTLLPDVTNQPYDQAAQGLQTAGFKVVKKTVSDQAAAGTVVDETPNGGQKVTTGSTVTLSVSDGSEATFPMPNLSGLSQSAAQSQLQGLGWTGSFNVSKQPIDNPEEQPGQIADQSPDVGAKISKNQTVDIEVYESPTTPPTSSPGGGGGFGGF